MVYTFLISTVFIAELIIAITIINYLFKLDKVILSLDDTLLGTKTSIKEVCVLARKISEQWKILAQDFVERVKNNSEDFLLKQLSKLLVGILVLNLNFKIVKKIRSSKLSKTLAKGWSLLESMV